MLSGHHSCTIDRSRHAHQIDRSLYKYTPRTKKSMSSPPLVYLASVPLSLIARPYCHSQHISLHNLHSPFSTPTLTSQKPIRPPIPPVKNPQTFLPKRKSNIQKLFIEPICYYMNISEMLQSLTNQQEHDFTPALPQNPTTLRQHQNLLPPTYASPSTPTSTRLKDTLVALRYRAFRR